MVYADLIEQRFEVVSVSGAEFLCVCPFHNDTGKPNLYANAEKGLYFCHACGAKGSLGEAEPTADRLRTLLRKMESRPKSATKTYPESWLQQFDNHTDYWSMRGFSDAIVRRFNLGYDVLRNEATIPVRRMDGKLIGAIRRRLDVDAGGPRYLYPRGFPLSRILFGTWMLGRSHSKIALVEGSLDAVACWDARVPALAMLGSNLTSSQHRILHELGVEHVVIFTDNDSAGRQAVLQIREEVSGIAVSAVKYRSYWNAKDPGELTKPQIRKAFHSAQPLDGMRRWD